MSYEEIKKRIKESIRKEEGRQKAINARRKERAAIKRGGGGHAIARKLMGSSNDGNDYDFNFGHNTQTTKEDIDKRIAEQAAGRCMGRAVCQKCGKFHGYCIEIEEKEKLNKMLPTGDNTSSSNRSRTGGLNFINTSDLSTSPKEAKILMVKYNEKSGQRKQPAVTIKMAFEGEMRYLWVPCRKDDPRYAVLLDAFGPDENDWIDKRINLFLEKDGFTEAYQTKISVPKGAKK